MPLLTNNGASKIWEVKKERHVIMVAGGFFWEKDHFNGG